MPKLGISNDQLMPCPDSPNCVNSKATDNEHSIQPILFNGTSKKAQERLLQILNNLKRAKMAVVEDNYIRFKFTSLIFRFVDDVEFYFPSTETEKVIIHIRSASRIGYSDFGANRKRIEQIRSKFKANL
ncbi:MAG: DUF1499 domain-containing protein [Cocleimonas sp.]